MNIRHREPPEAAWRSTHSPLLGVGPQGQNGAMATAGQR